jgi:hypothetical protein|tara:strand:- start:254 stop:538 length:285 start_codon:yes stop_codon:yes gene_type:complete
MTDPDEIFSESYKLEEFYREIFERTSDFEAPPPLKSMVLFRVAVETGAASIGMHNVMHLMSSLLTSGLAMMATESDVDFEEMLGDWDVSDSPKN